MIDSLKEISREAGALCLEIEKEGHLDTVAKSGGRWDVQTRADREAQDLIIARLQQLFPSTPILGEEDSHHVIPTGDFIVIDSLDGSTLFDHGYDHWGNIITYFKNSQPHIGIINIPHWQTIAFAERGRGCFLEHAEEKPIKVVLADEGVQLVSSVVSTEIGAWLKDEEIAHRAIVNLMKHIQWFGGPGFAAASQVDLLRKRSVAYVNFGAKLWDFSAGYVCATEAGGVVTDIFGNPLKWNSIPMNTVFANSKRLSDEIVRLINE